MKEFMIGIFIFVSISIILLLAIMPEKVIGTNMNNETKEYVRITDDSYGVTADGTRELLKSYKFKK
nr:MAG TPA: hypothetical protein [Caudoviricetes sp.]